MSFSEYIVKSPTEVQFCLPIPSTCAIFTYIWLISMVPVGKYTIHGSYGLEFQNNLMCFFRIFSKPGCLTGVWSCFFKFPPFGLKIWDRGISVISIREILRSEVRARVMWILDSSSPFSDQFLHDLIRFFYTNMDL